MHLKIDINHKFTSLPRHSQIFIALFSQIPLHLPPRLTPPPPPQYAVDLIQPLEYSTVLVAVSVK